MTKGNLIQNHCPGCRHALPEGASFCPYCETQLSGQTFLQAPVRKRRKLLCAAVLILALLLVVLWRLRVRSPKAYIGGSSVIYPMGKEQLQILASFDQSSAADGHLMEQMSFSLAPGDGSAHPIYLCAYSKEDPSFAEHFAEQIETCSIDIVPIPESETETEGTLANPDLSIFDLKPSDDPSSGILWSAAVFYHPEDGENELHWNIQMKNGDSIHLVQTILCSAMPTLDLHYEDVPLESVDDITAAMDSVSEDTILNLYLPPIVFSQPLTLSNRTVNLYGTKTDEEQTTFTSPVTIENRIPNLTEIRNICFASDGGTGILLHEGAIITGCSFAGWDIAVDAADGSWPIVEDCTFEENEIGLRFDSSSATCSNDGASNVVFRSNVIAVWLIKVPADLPFNFTECIFEGNGEDVRE